MVRIAVLVVVAVAGGCASDEGQLPGPRPADGVDGGSSTCSFVAEEDRACQDAADCVTVTLPSCCRTLVAGVNADRAQCYQDYQNSFDGASCPPDLGCPSGYQTDSGSLFSLDTEVLVTCEDSRCVSYTNPPE